MSPPMVSRALARLRDAFGDALLVRSGRGMTLTPRALELSPDIRECLSMLDRIDRRHKPTDLRNAEAQVSIRCDDVFAAVLCPELLETVAQEAPRLRLAIVSEH